MHRLVRHHRFDCVGCHDKGADHRVERDFFEFDAGQAQLQCFDQAAQAGVGGKLGDQRLGLRELPGDLLGFGGRQEQKAILAEKLAASGLRNGFEQVMVGREPLDERRGHLRGEFGRRGIENDQNRAQMLRKGPFERQFPLPPGQILRNQGIDVGIDGEMAKSVNARYHSRERRQHDHQPGVPGAASDGRYDCNSQHVLVFSRLFRTGGLIGRRRRVEPSVGTAR